MQHTQRSGDNGDGWGERGISMLFLYLTAASFRVSHPPRSQLGRAPPRLAAVRARTESPACKAEVKSVASPLLVSGQSAFSSHSGARLAADCRFQESCQEALCQEVGARM